MNRQQRQAPPKTGWPPELLQDDSCDLSRWFASRLDARYIVMMAATKKGGQR